MAEYRKKPVVIEAFQMTKERRWSNVNWPNWLHEAWNKEPGEEGAFWCEARYPDCIYLGTPEGRHEVTFDDWIIRNAKGELYPCKPDLFEMTYEAVCEEPIEG